MSSVDAHSEALSWDDPSWREKGDGPWRAGLRLQQGWWRESCLSQPPGPIRRKGGRPVVSMLPAGVGMSLNLMTDEAVRVAEHARQRLKAEKSPGLIQLDRLKRNLLSSQPLCFNLFGHLAANPESLLPWVRRIITDSDVEEVTTAELEWAPRENALARSAFDAFIAFDVSGGGRGFLGIECKYAENLKESQRAKASDKFMKRTREGGWRSGAAEALDTPGLRQLWYNQLLTQSVANLPEYDFGVGLVVACAADEAARQAVEAVRAQMTGPDRLDFCSLEDVVDSVEGDDAWKARFRERYLDFTPIQHLLPDGDHRRNV